MNLARTKVSSETVSLQPDTSTDKSADTSASIATKKPTVSNLDIEQTTAEKIDEANRQLIESAQQLIQKPSITPDDAGCIPWLIQQLEPLGFHCQQLDVNGVTNLIASIGTGNKTMAFLGHTDVVPAGDLKHWQHPPFAATVEDNFLYGRGAADMKTAIACMLNATKQFLTNGGQFNRGKFYWLITSDEEGEAEYGTKAMIEHLKQKGVTLDVSLVGEPTATVTAGDTIKIGRRGALSGCIKLAGKPGHVAYPDKIRNPINPMAKIIQALNNIEWDSGSADFPGSSLQITHINSGDFSDNVSPSYCEINFNIRYSHRWSEQQLKQKITALVQPEGSEFELQWQRPCPPYWNKQSVNPGSALTLLEQAIFQTTGRYPSLSTSGGTSDGRFAASLGGEVYEIGVCNATIHQVNEKVSVGDLITLRNIYQTILMQYFNC